MAVMPAVLDRLLDLALPAACAGCGREGEAICTACIPALDVRLELPPGVPVGLPVDLPAPLLQLEWCAPFSGVVRNALHGLKYASERRLAVPLGQAIARRWRAAGRGGSLLVPVPVHADRRRQRGYDQAELLATHASQALPLPMAPALERRRPTHAQYDLGRELRSANVAGAFTVRPGFAVAVRDRWVVLVDDVVTTGSTIAACGEALLQAGAAAVSAVTVARER